jgi:prepilin-type processing-associated H-X9-DG protein
VSNEEEIVWNGSTDPQTQYVSGVDYAYADKANFVFADGHVASRPRGYIFEGYEQRLNMASEIDPDLPGVCLEADPFSTNENDCPLPGQN